MAQRLAQRALSDIVWWARLHLEFLPERFAERFRQGRWEGHQPAVDRLTRAVLEVREALEALAAELAGSRPQSAA